MANLSWSRILFSLSLILLMPYIIMRIRGIVICVSGHFYPEMIDFLQLIITVTADLVYAYKGVRVLVTPDEKLLVKCYKYFHVCISLSIGSLPLTVVFDDEEMIAISYEVINLILLSFSGVCLFLFNMKLSDEKEEQANNNSNNNNDQL